MVTASITPVRLTVATAVGSIGTCEALATSPWFDPNVLPGWLALPIVMTGFFAVLFLWSFLGNAVVAIASLLVVWRAWQWPLWVAAGLSSPFWIVTYRLSPKPW
ncbi:MAG: hypothetical protein INR62_10330 [Rhodospirillales bacterium]|nr:hypothetical protein [Acetobacter sp.]